MLGFQHGYDIGRTRFQHLRFFSVEYSLGGMENPAFIQDRRPHGNRMGGIRRTVSDLSVPFHFNSSSYRERTGLRAVWGLPYPDSGRTPVVCPLLVLCTSWHGGRRRHNLIGRAASGMLRALPADSRRVKVDHASTDVRGGSRGRISDLLCGFTGAWNGGSWQCVVLVGSSPTPELCSGEPLIEWKELDAGQYPLGWTMYTCNQTVNYRIFSQRPTRLSLLSV